MSETRKLAAILVADVVGYSLLAGADEERTLARLRALRSDLIDPTIALHHGRIVKRTGDGSIIEFSQCGGCRPVRDRSADRNGRAQRRPAAGKAHRIPRRRPSGRRGRRERRRSHGRRGQYRRAPRRHRSARSDLPLRGRLSPRGSTWRSLTLARPNSRTSKGRSGSIRWRSGYRLRQGRRQRRSRARSGPSRRRARGSRCSAPGSPCWL